MTDQEITDRDETRRLAYIALAVADYRVRDARLHELIGTLAHALAHHAGGLQGQDGTEIVRAITGGIFDGDLRMVEEIDALTAQIEQLKRPGRLVTANDDVEAILDTPRRTFLKVVYTALDDVANIPDARWFNGDSDSDTMHQIEVALDAYDSRLASDYITEAERDLTHALSTLDGLLRSFYEKGHPGYAALRTGWHSEIDVDRWREWLASARNRQAKRGHAS